MTSAEIIIDERYELELTDETTLVVWISDAVVGAQGPPGPAGPAGPAGADGTPGAAGPEGPAGPAGPTGSDSTVPGPPGPQGIPGEPGPQGPAGADGAAGADSIVPGPAGPPGIEGDSAYELALLNGFEGTAAEWLLSLVGEQGLPGVPGEQGVQGIPGAAGANGIDGAPGTDGLTTSVNGVSQVAGNVTLTGSYITFTPMDGTGNLPVEINTLQELVEAIDSLEIDTYTDEQAQDATAAAIAAGTHAGITVTYDDANNKFSFNTNPTPYNCGTVDANATIDPANGRDQYITIGNAATTGITLAITNPADTSKSFDMKLEVIRSSGNQRVVTLTGTNFVCTGASFVGGKILPSSGAGASDKFNPAWCPRPAAYEFTDARYDVKAS